MVDLEGELFPIYFVESSSTLPEQRATTQPEKTKRKGTRRNRRRRRPPPPFAASFFLLSSVGIVSKEGGVGNQEDDGTRKDETTSKLMWKLVCSRGNLDAEGKLRTLNAHVGRQTWEFDANASEEDVQKQDVRRKEFRENRSAPVSYTHLRAHET